MRNSALSHVIFRRVATILMVSVLATGCASPSTRPEAQAGTEPGKGAAASDKVLERRSVERWEFLIKRQAEKAYDYLSPGFRATKKREDYAREMNNRPIHWTRVLPYSQECEKPDVCVVNLQIDYETKMPGLGKDVSSLGFVKETWIKSRGKWYLLPGARNPTGGK